MSYQKLKTDESANWEEVEKAEKEIYEVLKKEDFAKKVAEKKECQKSEFYAEVTQQKQKCIFHNEIRKYAPSDISGCKHVTGSILLV